jgi:Golgi nucleoside diphosphatase
MCGGSEGIGECFSLSGWLKILESFCIFTLIMLQRIGDSTKKVRESFNRFHFSFSLSVNLSSIEFNLIYGIKS